MAKVNINQWYNKSKKIYNGYIDGVFHYPEEKVAVASDSFSLLVSKPDYIDFNTPEIKKVFKDGAVKRAQFPIRYKQLIPSEQACREVIIDFEEFKKRKNKIGKVLNCGDKTEMTMVPLNTTDVIYLRKRACQLLLSLPKGTFSIWVSESKEQARLKYQSEDGNYTALFEGRGVKCTDDGEIYL